MATLTKRWVASYAAFMALSLALAFSILPALFRPGPAALPGVMLAALVATASITAVAVPLLVRFIERGARRSLARLDASVEPLLVAVAYAEPGSRYRRRPPGVLVVTSEELRFLASDQKDRAHDFAWSLHQLDAVEPVRDRFGIVSRVFDLQGALCFRLGAEARTVSVVGCFAFQQALGELWGRAQARGPSSAE